MSDDQQRINQEWIVLNAVRGMVKIASKGSMTKSTYDNSLQFAGVLYPELLGPDVSLLKRERESDTTKEYRQLAELRSEKNGILITPLSLVLADIEEYQSLINVAKQRKGNKQRTDQLKRKLGQLQTAKAELEIKPHSENQLIFRDAYNVDRNIPELSKGHAHKDFQLPDERVLRLRILHPDRPEHVTGADIIYERHDVRSGEISIVVIQYKIWEDKKISITDQRMKDQLKKIKCFTCEKKLCEMNNTSVIYRFPCCSGFLRPTDKLQNIDQKFISTGEHIPICKIDEYKTIGARGGEYLEYEKIKEISLSSELFEDLFNKGKIGSRNILPEELKELYVNSSVIDSTDTVVIYAQEF